MNAVAKFHHRIDTFVRRAVDASPIKPCCAKGCHACCDEALYASYSEVDHALEGLSPSEKEEVKARLVDWLAKTKEIRKVRYPNATVYRRLRVSCPFLKDGLCSVYERRPFGCRIFLAIGNPADCGIETRDRQRYCEFGPGQKHLFAYVKPAFQEMVHSCNDTCTDHVGVLLAERLLGLKLPSASREERITRV